MTGLADRLEPELIETGFSHVRLDMHSPRKKPTVILVATDSSRYHGVLATVPWVGSHSAPTPTAIGSR